MISDIRSRIASLEADISSLQSRIDSFSAVEHPQPFADVRDYVSYYIEHVGDSFSSLGWFAAPLNRLKIAVDYMRAAPLRAADSAIRSLSSDLDSRRADLDAARADLAAAISAARERLDDEAAIRDLEQQ